MKSCFKCGKAKELELFYRHPYMADGRLGKCIECAKKDSIAQIKKKKKDPRWVDWERDRCRKKQKKRRESGFKGKSSSGSRSKWLKKFPEKRKAQIIAGNAKRSGLLKSPGKCQSCGKRPKRIQMHHEDYKLPLQVLWLCSSCHGMAHWKPSAESCNARK